MSRIKVTGYLNTEELPMGSLDPDSETGLSESGFYAQHDALSEHLDGIEFEVES